MAEAVDMEVVRALLRNLWVAAFEIAFLATVVWGTFALFLPALGITWCMALLPAGTLFVVLSLIDLLAKPTGAKLDA